MLFEHQLPLTSKRADVILVGEDPRSGDPSYVIVELKQWSEASVFEDDITLVSVPAYGRPVTHPVLQVRDYCDYLVDFTTVLEDRADAVSGAAYLHNASATGVSQLFGLPGDQRGRLFTGDRRGEFVDFLRSHLAENRSGAGYADELLSSRIAPSRQLLSVAAEEVQRREMFVLLDEQRDAYNYVLHEVDRARRADSKSAVIITGGPGTGKSVIALSLLGELSRQGRAVLHATGSRSFTETLRKVAGKRSTKVKAMFKYFNSFMAAEANDLDVLILDEAHRVRETSVNRWTKTELRTKRSQLDELFSAARVPVFLLDEHQVVRPGELGTVTDIELYAAEHEIPVTRISLDDQFRCGGSEAYVDWVQRLLGLRPGGPVAWEGDPNFTVDVVESPFDLDDVMRRQNAEGYTARITAGYCWPWSDPRKDGTLVNDVSIADWSKPWNLKGPRAVGGAPTAPFWASDPAGFGQVGCVYTAQGFEYDYAGVIIGRDLVWRTDRWIAQRLENRDPDFRNLKTVANDRFDQLVRNVYKVLLTRGMQGVTIYSTDSETRRFLDSLMPSQPGQ
ncbi:DUF2075 domain-containing protein [Rudaeicoccus suwonensis]|nr:DUF2075 domain-containing protein [Rudaeicoccus suwonensis]